MRFIKQRFSTADVSASDRTAMWGALIQDINFSFAFRPADDRPYSGALRRYAVDDFQVVAFDEGQAEFHRDDDHIRTDGIGVFEVFAPTRGRCVVEQFGSAEECGPGSMFFVDAAAPFRLTQQGRMAGVILKTSRAAMERYLPGVESMCGRVVDGRQGLPRVTRDMLRSIGGQGDSLQMPQFESACHHLMDLMAMIVDGARDLNVADGRVRGATLARLKAHIREHAADPRLGTGDVAAAFGLSERYVQMLFQGDGTTVRDYVRRQRLDEARRQLANPARRDRTITEIAYASGFSSSAHFSTAFRMQYGLSPREFRSQALGRGPAPG